MNAQLATKECWFAGEGHHGETEVENRVKLVSFIGEWGVKFGAVASRARRCSLVVLKPWLKVVDAEQMVGQESGQGHRQIASISLGRWADRV